MNVSALKPFDFNQALAKAGLRADGTPISGGTTSTPAVTPTSGQGSFTTAMADALKSVSAQQNQADYFQRELQMDNPTVSLEQTMVSMQKAQIGFQAALTVRNRLVQSYTDIMNMQV
jgi:flagellar hook-basal body complex protein FliE